MAVRLRTRGPLSGRSLLLLFAALLATTGCTRKNRPGTAVVEGGAISTSQRSESSAHGPGASDAGAWGAVEAKVAEVVRAHDVKGLGLAVYDANDKKVFEKMFGDFTP